MIELTEEEFEQIEQFLRHVVAEATARGGPSANQLFNHWERASRLLTEVKERHPALKERVL